MSGAAGAPTASLDDTMTATNGTSDPDRAGLRPLLLAILAFGVLGTLTELLLLEHYEEWWQLTPLTLLGLSIPAMAGCWLRPSPLTVRALRGLMVLFLVAAALGVYHHYSGNAEFELEMYPDRSGFELVSESLYGATPVFAPGALAWLGLLGLAYTYRHPRGPQ